MCLQTWYSKAVGKDVERKEDTTLFLFTSSIVPQLQRGVQSDMETSKANRGHILKWSSAEVEVCNLLVLRRRVLPFILETANTIILSEKFSNTVLVSRGT